MNTKSLIEEIEREAVDRMVSRREAMSKVGSLGAGLALAAIPFGATFLASTGRAYAQGTTPTLVEVLNFALTLEYLESEFYNTGIVAVPASDKVVFEQIRKHENAHVILLKNTIVAVGGTAVAKPTFDFTAGGAFADWNSNYSTFLALSQSFEDAGVRAYKGQASNPNLMANDAVLTAALQIHSVEARHAAMVRRIRNSRGDTSTRPWITEASRGDLPAGVQPVYAGEENKIQGGVDTGSGTGGFTGISSAAASEAFDEPLTMDQVLAIATLFIK